MAGLEGRVLRKRDTGDAAPYHMMEISTLRQKEKKAGSLNSPFSDSSSDPNRERVEKEAGE